MAKVKNKKNQYLLILDDILGVCFNTSIGNETPTAILTTILSPTKYALII
jgi:hypothetical protein